MAVGYEIAYKKAFKLYKRMDYLQICNITLELQNWLCNTEKSRFIFYQEQSMFINEDGMPDHVTTSRKDFSKYMFEYKCFGA